jgi:hypothetical protein
LKSRVSNAEFPPKPQNFQKNPLNHWKPIESPHSLPEPFEKLFEYEYFSFPFKFVVGFDVNV